MKTSPNNSGTHNKGFAELALIAAAGVLALGMFASSVWKSTHTPAPVPQTPAAGSINTVGGVTYYLYGSGVGASNSSITLTSFKIAVSNQKLQMTDFGTIGYLTLEPGNITRQEFVSFTGVTQNTDGTATLTGVSRGLAPITPFTASSTLQKAHAGGTQAVISNPPQIYELFANKTNDQTITGTWNFASTAPPRFDVDPGAAYYTTAPTTVFVDLAQLNRTSISGAANASETQNGIIELATGKEVASSTSLGATGARLGLPASLATSSPSATATTSIVATRLDGRIDPGFFGTTSATTYTMGGLIANTNGIVTNASSTLNGTTTITANVATGKGVCMNGICYTAPSAQGAANTVLVNDGTGRQSWSSVPELNTVGVTGISLSTTGWATSTTQLVLPAGALSASSTIEVIGGGTGSASAANAAMNCTLYIRDSTGVTLNSFTVTSAGVSGASAPYTYHAFISLTTGITAQKTYIAGIGVDSGMGAGSGVTTLIDTLGSSAINFANALTLTVVVQDATTNGGCSNTNVKYVVKP